MSNLILIPFSVFFVCCLLQFWYLKKVRDALIDRHPETFLAVEKSPFWPVQSPWKYLKYNQYKQFGDDDLDRHVRNLRRVIIVGIGAWVVFALSLFTTGFSEPRLPIAIANGSFANSCCGTISLRDGRMIVANQQVDYVIESDKLGPYVLPSFYVGASAHGFDVRREHFPLKLRIDNDSHPAEIGLLDDGEGGQLSFQRVSGS